MPEYQIYGLSDIGLVRKKNEDVWIAKPKVGLFALADGIGGHKAGEVAAKETIQNLSDYITEKLDPISIRYKEKEVVHTLNKSIHYTNQKIYLLGEKDEGLKGMGTTICMIYFFKKKAFICHVGDSRIYLFRKKKLKQLTLDHSLVEHLKALGQFNKTSIPKNVITQAIGVSRKVIPEISTLRYQPGDIFFLCSDGLTDFVLEEEILNILNHKISLKTTVGRLIHRAKEKGSNDNITILMVKIG